MEWQEDESWVEKSSSSIADYARAEASAEAGEKEMMMSKAQREKRARIKLPTIREELITAVKRICNEAKNGHQRPSQWDVRTTWGRSRYAVDKTRAY